MRRKVPEPIEAGGQDSFVDVVTNLVGILIVLVLLVGVRVKPAWKAANSADSAAAASAGKQDAANDPKTDQAVAEFARLRATADSIEQNVRQTSKQIAAINRTMAAREREHDQLGTAIALAEHELADRRAALGHDSQSDYDLRRQLADTQAQALKERQEISQADAYQPPPVELRHYLTPLSHTVFGHEVHFRLAQGHIAYVPFDELIERAKQEIGQIGSITAATEQKHVVGPVMGFQMEYTLAMLSGERGAVGVQGKECRIEPTDGTTGEPVREALGTSSELRRRLSLLVPRDTTITIWVYADSFSEFRLLNDELYRLGFAVAGRPLPPGLSIAFSPDGTRSAAQ